MRGDCSVRVDGLGFASEEIAACVARQGLLSLELELAAEKCDCAAADGPHEPLPPGEISDLVEQAKTLGARRIILVSGQRQRYPHLQLVIENIRASVMEIELFTRGAGITTDFAEFLRDQDVAVIVGLDSMSREVHNRLAGWDEAFDVAHQAVKNLTAAGYGNSGKRLAIRTAVSEQNIGHPARIVYVHLAAEGFHENLWRRCCLRTPIDLQRYDFRCQARSLCDVFHLTAFRASGEERRRGKSLGTL